jgi:5-methylcytosine-specific restriction protein B
MDDFNSSLEDNMMDIDDTFDEIDLTGFVSIDGSDVNEIPARKEPPKKNPLYTKFDFEREVFGTDVVDLIEILEYKMNIILQGSPGVGKTYTAKRLAYAMLGEKDESRVLQVQFHQSYTYDDFVMGLKPTEDGGFKFDYGPFYKICKKAECDISKRPYFMIIDEINRGNMSKILGEMFSLIEKDHRNESIVLKYNNEWFSVPDNLYIIGTMNTADRGLVMLDYALRRRFAFITVEPKFKSEGFRQLLATNKNMKFNKLTREIVALNEQISRDEMLGPGFMIGHSYFCMKNDVTDEILKNIVNYEILPLLEEYWYDAPEKVTKWREKFERILASTN